ncbi:MAG: hypothetical protein E6K82_22850 [Candidatus Rokuibacteriota bacterium]|nr:MAG: hypothetical protein E6K82_22850 [Candidatus Rokubacteria bacterium]
MTFALLAPVSVLLVTRETQLRAVTRRRAQRARSSVEDTMIGIRSTALVMGLCGALAASAGYAQDSPFVGRWHWNRAQSKLPPGEPAPKDVVSEVSRADGTSVAWSVTIVTPDDERHVVTFEADPAGDAQHGSDTTASARMADETLQATFNGPAGRSDTQTCMVSANRKQMTCKGVLSDGQGHSVSYVDVYDRM